MRAALAIVLGLAACGSVEQSEPDAPAGGGDAAGGADGSADGAGGSDGAAGGDATQGSVTVASTAALDGYVRTDGTVASDVDYLNVGDRSDGQAVYGFVSFETGVPSGATITTATLTVFQDTVTGTPYGAPNLGALRVQHVDYGSSLEGADFAITADPATSVVVASNANADVGVAETADVVTIVGPCVGTTTCQFRLRFARDTEDPASDGGFDYVTLSSGEHATATQRPSLALTWTVP